MAMTMQHVSLTATERQAAVDLLTESAWAVREATTDLDERQWRFEPAPGRWAIADIVEHLVKSEQAVYQLVTEKLLPTPARPATRRPTLRDLAVILAVRNRNVRFQAAELVRPTRTWTMPEALAGAFGAARVGTVNFIRDTTEDLRGRIAEHPVLGDIDAYQWFLFLGAHTQRHVDQLREVKADPAFPRKQMRGDVL